MASHPNPPQLPVSEPPQQGRRKRGNLLWGAVGVALLFLVWEMIARSAGPLVISTPGQTFLTLADLLTSTEFHQHFWLSLLRMLLGVSIGAAAGLILGILAGLSGTLRGICEPFRWVAMSVPPAAVLVVLMLWLGTDTLMVVTTTAFLLSPVVYVNTIEGMALIDRELEEMARVYRFSLGARVRHIFLPALSAPLGAAAVQVLAGAVRVVILAELLGTSEGMGAAVHNAAANLEISLLFAWVVLSVALVGFTEYVLLRPMQRWLLRWRETA